MSRRCVLVGYGYWGRIISGYLKDAGFDPVSVFDRKEGISFEDFLKQHDAQAVFICSPVSTHFEYAREALLHGCDVFCEKMLTADPEKARELYSIADEKGRVLFTDYIYLYSPSIRKMKELLGTSGDIGSIEGRITQYGKFYIDVDVIGNIGVHLISAAGFLTDFKQAQDITVSDISLKDGRLCECTLGYRAGDVNLELFQSLISENKVRKITVEGSRDTFVFDMNAKETLRTDKVNFEFDEHNNLVNSLSVFASVISGLKYEEYRLNRTCCIFTEDTLCNLYKKYKDFHTLSINQHT